MNVISRTYLGIAYTLYYLDIGEKVPRHQHPVDHIACVVAGRAQIEIWTNPIHLMELIFTDYPQNLPANIDHEITGLEAGTIVLNMIAASAPSSKGQSGAKGGVMLESGDVVPVPVAVTVSPNAP